MKKTILTILLCGVTLLVICGCGGKSEEDTGITEKVNEEVLQCLESELGGYLVTEKDILVEIPLSEIKDNNDKIAYYKGVYASEHPNNMYTIVVEKNKIFDYSVMKDFDKYFYQKFSVYQKYEIASEGISIFIHNNSNDVDFNSIKKKCISNNVQEGKSLPSKTVNKINNTNKIVIKSFENELGTVSDKNKLTKILNTISSSKQYGENFLCDGHGFNFELYNANNELIDIIYVWGDGKRLVPKSINGSGCSYYSILNNDIDLRKIIEDETDYIFYGISDYSETCDQALELIFEDKNNNYYLSCQKSDEVFITFTLKNQTMTLKYALNNSYISADKISKDYPDILIKK